MIAVESHRITAAETRRKVERIQATYDRRLKSKAAIREVPVHSTLIALGLRDFVDGFPGKAPLFPDLRPTGAYKEFGEQLGKWFRTYRQARGLYR
ncbi:MAG: hypothetical protein H5U13_07370 [Parvibaculum sp.]|nr:hypothetical protein [Parvibaculum sp.]